MVSVTPSFNGKLSVRTTASNDSGVTGVCRRRETIMTDQSSEQTRRTMLATTAAAGIALTALSGLNISEARQTMPNESIRPFRMNIPQNAIDDLRRRIAATRLPEKETVADGSQGVPLATMQKLLRYWEKEYDWRKIEKKMNAYPNFMTEIDGLDIHFIHVRSKHENALPVIVTHGWPGSPIEQLKIIDLLTDPTAHGGSAADAFHVVIPSMPGYGFSGRPATTGWDSVRIARAWNVLMKRLGYAKYVAQGGDWGALVVDQMGVQAPPELLAIHTNMAGAVPVDLDKAASTGGLDGRPGAIRPLRR
jgi:hypothetical protein